MGSQYSLVTKDTFLTGVRMVLKLLVAATWATLFIIYYRFSPAPDPFFGFEIIYMGHLLVNVPFKQRNKYGAWHRVQARPMATVLFPEIVQPTYSTTQC